jgi:hypothetical protein
LERFIDYTHKEIDFNIKITYFNTSSSKCILEILRILRRFRDKGGKLFVTWHLNKQDEDLEDEVQYFSIATGIEINLVWIN